MTTTPKFIQIQTAAPRGSDPGAVAIAYYVVDDNKKLRLTDRDGLTLHDAEGKESSRMLAENDGPRQVVGQLLRSFRAKVRGDRVSGFDRPLVYPRLGKI